MAEAKVDISVAVEDAGLKRLNSSLASGQQNVKTLRAELKNLERETQNGTKATEEQRAALQDLQQQLNIQTEANKRYSKAIKEAYNSALKQAEGANGSSTSLKALAGSMLEGVNASSVMNTAIGMLTSNLVSMAADLAGDVVTALADFVASVFEAGAAAQSTVAQFAAMKYNVDDAVTSYRIFNDLTRDLTYDPAVLNQMMVQLINLGYSAKNAADLIRQCADTAAGLGQGASGAQQLVDAISRIQATGELTNRQLVALKTAGINLDEAFSSLGLSGDDAMQAVEEGTLEASDAVAALSDYMHEFDGSMETSKQNIDDAWEDVTGNLSACCEEIGLSILNAFDQSEIVQKLIEFTQDLLDMIRSDGVSIFSDFGDIASYALSLVGDGMQIIINVIKVVIMMAHEMYAAFRSLGVRIANALSPILQPLGEIFSILSKILGSLGQQISAGIDVGWHNEFPGAPDTGSEENNFRPTQRAAGGGSAGGAHSGGGGGGGRSGGGESVSREEREEERQIDALIKKYADADKQKQALAKASIELAKANAAMLVGENKKAEENRISLQGLKDAHDKLLTGWDNELEVAGKIADAEIRDKVIRSINEQIDAENKLYEAKVKSQEFQYMYDQNKEATKTLLDNILGTDDEVVARIKEIKKTLKESLNDVDVAMANPNEEEALNGMAKLLQMAPEDLEEELAAKGETLQAFAEQYKETLAETSEAEIQQLSIGEQWSNKMKSYAETVGKSMGSAMADFIMGAKTAKEALGDFVRGIIQNAVSILTEWLAVFAIYSAFPMWASGMTPADAANKTVFGVSMKKATGGLITGPGTGTSDSIPAMLSSGEYVINAAAVQRLGTAYLDTLNSPHYAEGGQVGTPAMGVAGSGGSVTLNVSAMDASSFMDFLRGGGMDSIKQMLFDGTRDFTTDAGVW
jgi:uncharacterized membrane protein YgcG